MSQLNVSRIMKIGDPAAQCDIQSVGSDGKLDDVGILSLVLDRVTPMTFTHYHPRRVRSRVLYAK
jgi:hypothetical protein